MIIKESDDLMLFDHKRYIEHIINKNGDDLDSIKLIMRSFEYFCEHADKGEKDYEYREPACAIYRSLKWDINRNETPNRNYDVINSFWTTFSWGLRHVDNATYSIAPAGNITIYKRHKEPYFSFPEKYNRNNKKELDDVLKLCEKYPTMSYFAELCHCVANFMPCPGDNYNEAKGCLPDVQDYFPLMVNKIQDQIDKHAIVSYKIGKEEKYIDVETFIKWQKWFIDNRERFFLEDYYYVIKEDNGNERLIGIPLFRRQSLSYPTPLEKEEVKECLDNMIRIIKYRALKMNYQIKRYNLCMY